MESRNKIAAGAIVRVWLFAASVHLAQCVFGGFAQVYDEPARVGHPLIFASWGGYCGPYGCSSRFESGYFVFDVMFWSLGALFWAVISVLRSNWRDRKLTPAPP